MESRAVSILVGLVGGVVMTVVAVFMGLGSQRLRKRGRLADGVIAQLVKRDSSGNGMCYYPEFRFEDQQGRPHTVISAKGSSSLEFDVGQPVRVLYDPEQPEVARIDTFAEMWLFPLLFGIAGPASVVLALLVWMGVL